MMHPTSRAQRLALKRDEFERKQEKQARSIRVKRIREAIRNEESLNELRRIRSHSQTDDLER